MRRLIAMVTLAVVTLAACTTAPVTDRRQLALVSAEALAEQSTKAYDELVAESDVVTGTADARMVRRVGERIAASAEEFLRNRGLEDEIPLYEWEFALIGDDESVNAFAMPGGKVAVYTGILPIAQDEQGLAVIMGHEVAHVVANHGQERVSQQLLAQLGAATIAEVSEEEPEQTRRILLAAYGAGAQVGFLLPYSRRHEEEADTIGLILTARAGYDPRVAIPFWRRMAEEGGTRPPEFLSTHPDPESRIENLRDQLPRALEYYSESGSD
ncbi:MAG: M48 family metallopeptidase [Spirochaetota bacterium]